MITDPQEAYEAIVGAVGFAPFNRKLLYRDFGISISFECWLGLVESELIKPYRLDLHQWRAVA